MPILGYIEGQYGDVVDVAFSMAKFWQWGRGGSVEKINILSLDDVEKVSALEKRKSELQKEIDSINKKLEEF